MTTIDCQGALSLLMPYLDSELDAATTQLVNGHLLRCPSCRRRYEAEQLLESGLAVLAADAEPLPEPVAARLDQALAAARDADPSGPALELPARPTRPQPVGRRRGPSAPGRRAPGRRAGPWRVLTALAAAAAVLLAVHRPR